MASFTNVATLSYGGNQVSSNVVTGEIREVLTVSKTAVPAAYAVGDTITYVIYLINSGTAALTRPDGHGRPRRLRLRRRDGLSAALYGRHGPLFRKRCAAGGTGRHGGAAAAVYRHYRPGRAAPPRSSIRQRSRPTRRPRRTGSSAIP